MNRAGQQHEKALAKRLASENPVYPPGSIGAMTDEEVDASLQESMVRIRALQELMGQQPSGDPARAYEPAPSTLLQRALAAPAEQFRMAG